MTHGARAAECVRRASTDFKSLQLQHGGPAEGEDVEDDESEDEDEDDDEEALAEKFSEAFNQIDIDSEGSIVAEQLGSVLECLGMVSRARHALLDSIWVLLLRGWDLRRHRERVRVCMCARDRTIHVTNVIQGATLHSRSQPKLTLRAVTLLKTANTF